MASANKIKLSEWQFKKGEIAKLIWISDPIKIDGTWKAHAYFKSLINGEIKKHRIDWGTVAILKIGELYLNGKEIRNKEKLDPSILRHYNSKTNTFYFKGQSMKIEERCYTLEGDDFSDTVLLNSFVYREQGNEYHIPVIEVLRAIVARNKALLYACLEPNSLHYFFNWQRVGNKFVLDSKGEYKHSKLTNSQHAYYVCWLLSNPTANKAWNDIYRSLLLRQERLEFTFPFKGDCEIHGRYHVHNGVIKIEQILESKGMELHFKFLEINNVPAHETKKRDEQKKYIFVSKPTDELEVEESKGARKDTDIVKLSMATMEFQQRIPIIHTKKKNINQNQYVGANTNKNNFSELASTDANVN